MEVPQKIVLVCAGCGRADEALEEVDVRRRHNIVKAYHLETNPGRNAFVRAGVREVPKVGGSCALCTERSHLEWIQVRHKRAERWRLGWPNYVARSLRSECALEVWRMLPVQLRYQWRHLKKNIPDDVLLTENVEWIGDEDMKIPEVMTMEDFIKCSEDVFDTKCGICRGNFPKRDMQLLPLWRFPCCNWVSRNVVKAIRHPEGAEA